MEVTIIYENGTTIGAYTDAAVAMEALLTEACRAGCDYEIAAKELSDTGAIADYWYYDTILVDTTERKDKNV